MKKEDMVLIGLSIFFILFAVLAFVLKKKKTSENYKNGNTDKEKDVKKGQTSNSNQTTSQVTNYSTSKNIFPLKYRSGFTGNKEEQAAVTIVQKSLNLIPPPTGSKDVKVDGQFGKETEAALYHLLGVKEVSKEIFDKFNKV